MTGRFAGVDSRSNTLSELHGFGEEPAVAHEERAAFGTARVVEPVLPRAMSSPVKRAFVSSCHVPSVSRAHWLP